MDILILRVYGDSMTDKCVKVNHIMEYQTNHNQNIKKVNVGTSQFVCKSQHFKNGTVKNNVVYNMTGEVNPVITF